MADGIDRRPRTIPLDRAQLDIRPLAERANRVQFPADAIEPDTPPPACTPPAADFIAETAQRIRAARAADRPVILAFGAHAIKNGLGPVLVRLMHEGWLTHLATNGGASSMIGNSPSWARPARTCAPMSPRACSACGTKRDAI